VKPLPLNLASRPFRNNLLVGTLLVAAGCALVFGTAYNLYVYLSYGASYATLQHAQAEDRARITELQKQERALADEVRKRDFKSVYSRGKLASELIRKSAFSWTQLFNTLETVVPPNVVLAAIRPNISSEGIVLRIEGVAKDHMALLNLEEKLQGHDAFKRVSPISERKLNPNLPDITFLVTCDYIPPQQAKLDLKAAQDAAVNTATEAITAAAMNPAAAAAAVGKAPSPAPAPAPAPGPAAASGDVVGRDGLPKNAGAGSVIAPGGLLIAEAIAAPSGKGRKDAGKPPAARSAAIPQASATNPASADVAGTPAGRTNAGKTNAGMKPVTGPAAPRTVPPLQVAAPRGYDPNNPRTMPPKLQMAMNRPKAGPPPVAAQRLDIALSFVGQPAAEVYQALAQAHGVRIDLDPTVDPRAPVTLDLKGRKLEDALMLLAGILHTRTTKPAEGIYRIVSTEVRAPAADAPPIEEPVVEEANR
jgi:hypothetical protein